MALSASLASAQPMVMQQDMFADMKEHDKAVVVAVHYGTTNVALRQSTIDKFNARLRSEFPDCDFRQAWTSRSVIRDLDARGEVVYTPVRLLRELRDLGYTHVLIQSSEVINGVEMQHLRTEFLNAKKWFKQIRLGEPLLTDLNDFEMAILATASAYGEEKKGNVLVCQGTKGALNSCYTMIDYMLRDKGLDNWYVTTIDGYPNMESLKRELKARREKKINLIPFFFAADDRIVEDVAAKMKTDLQNAGHKVEVLHKSLGESDEILDRYMEHARFARQYRTLTPTEIKLVESTY